MTAGRSDSEETLARLRAENAALREQQAAAAREHARLLDEAQALQTVAAELASVRDMRALLDGIVTRTAAVLDADGVGVWLLDEETGEMHVAANRGLSDAFLRTLLPRPLRPSPTTMPV